MHFRFISEVPSTLTFKWRKAHLRRMDNEWAAGPPAVKTTIKNLKVPSHIGVGFSKIDRLRGERFLLNQCYLNPELLSLSSFRKL